MLILYYGICINLERFHKDPRLFHMGAIMIATSALNTTWFYKGSENFRIITLFTISLRFLSIIAVFVFVNVREDYTLYFFIYFLSNLLTNLILWLLSIYTIGFQWKWDFKRHLKPILLIFGTNVVISIYVMLDSIMLGLLSTDTELGLYTASIKVNKIMVTVITSLAWYYSLE